MSGFSEHELCIIMFLVMRCVCVAAVYFIWALKNLLHLGGGGGGGGKKSTKQQNNILTY